MIRGPDAMNETTPSPTERPTLMLPARGLFGGVLMGLANLVPGISGGTMLLAAGVYPQFIGGVAEITTFRFRLRSIILLAAVAVGAIGAIVGLAGPVKDLVVHHRWIMYSLFIGLTLGGVPVIWGLMKRFSATSIIAAVIGIGVMAVMAFLQPRGGAPAAGESHPYLLYALAGLAGAAAMVLPGVSGGYLLLVLGQYVVILSAIALAKDGAAERDWAAIGEAMHVIIPVGIGVLIGIVGVSNLIKWLLQRFPQATLGFLLGLVLGAVLGLWPFQQGVPPEMGSIFRGDEVTLVDDLLVMAATGRPIEPEEYPTALFAPAWWQILAALAIIVGGFLASTLIAHIGATRNDS
jgi:putative membrane protein